MKKKYFQILIGLLILSALYTPQGYIIDREAWQWLYLSAINLGALTYNLYMTLKGTLKPLKTPFSFKIISILFIWAIASILYSLSFQVAVIDLSRFFIYLVSFYNLLIVFNETEISFKQLSYLFTVLFIIEIFFSYKPLFEIISQGSFQNYDPNILEGIASNVNVTSFSIALKVPFLIYLFYNEKRNFLKAIFISLLILGYVLLNFLDTRAITLSNYFILFIILGFSLVNFNKRVFLKSIILISTIFFSFNIPSFLDSERSEKNQELIEITSNSDESTNQRLRYYKAGIKQIISNPFLGVGFGNWKLESIKYDKNASIQYIVPYHMHNDFLQFGAELGLIGLILYLTFFTSIFFKYLIDLKNFKIRWDSKALVTLLFFTYIFFDSSLNFPFARPMVFLQLLIFIAFLEKQLNKHPS
ncbi:O-antigen ligase family protein [Flavobacteriaceae bacterium]|nr:O-antigen ligase family protein [Flavobacteriaceae bacterium]